MPVRSTPPQSRGAAANREAWLLKAVEFFTPHFRAAGFRLPPVKVSLGLPTGRGSKASIAQCWARRASKDGLNQIFVSPTVDDSLQVVSALIHELAHAHLDNKGGHGPRFKAVAKAVGLEGPMRSTHAGDYLKGQINHFIKEFGKIPHAALNPSLNPVKKQTTRMLKMRCSECGYICRASHTPILQWGPVLCPCSQKRDAD
jgi:hypothetical protein